MGSAQHRLGSAARFRRRVQLAGFVFGSTYARVPLIVVFATGKRSARQGGLSGGKAPTTSTPSISSGE